MNPTPENLRQRLIDRASQPFRSAGRFAYHFARGKLGGDPVYRVDPDGLFGIGDGPLGDDPLGGTL